MRVFRETVEPCELVKCVGPDPTYTYIIKHAPSPQQAIYKVYHITVNKHGMIISRSPYIHTRNTTLYHSTRYDNK